MHTTCLESSRRSVPLSRPILSLGLGRWPRGPLPRCGLEVLGNATVGDRSSLSQLCWERQPASSRSPGAHPHLVVERNSARFSSSAFGVFAGDSRGSCLSTWLRTSVCFFGSPGAHSHLVGRCWLERNSARFSSRAFGVFAGDSRGSCFARDGGASEDSFESRSLETHWA